MTDGAPAGLLEYAQDKIAVLDADGTVEYANGATERILGFEPEQLIGESAFRRVHPEDREALRDAFGRVVGSDEPFPELTVEYRHRTADGSWAWLESRIAEYRGPELQGYVVSSRDVTDRVAAERRRFETETRLRELAERTDDVLWTFDSDWEELLFINDAVEEVFGVTAERMREEPLAFLECIHPDDVERVEAVLDRLSEGESVDVEYRVNPGEDYRRWVWVQGEPIVEDGEVVRVVGFTRDVTGRRRRKRQLVVMDNLLRHNLRNDLNVILGNAELVAEAATGEPAERAGTIEAVAEELLTTAEKQREIIPLLTDAVTPRPVDVAAAVGDAVDAVEAAHPDATVEAALPDAAVARTVPQIESALRELLENAARHAPDDEPTVRVGVAVRDDGAIGVTIRDDCPPMPEFERRVLTGNYDMDDVHHSSGLGLWLVYWAVDLSGGDLRFASDESGNSVGISLPRASVPE